MSELHVLLETRHHVPQSLSECACVTAACVMSRLQPGYLQAMQLTSKFRAFVMQLMTFEFHRLTQPKQHKVCTLIGTAV